MVFFKSLKQPQSLIIAEQPQLTAFCAILNNCFVILPVFVMQNRKLSSAASQILSHPFGKRSIWAEYVCAWDMSMLFIWSGDPIICDPLDPFPYCASSVNWIWIHFSHPATFRVHEVVIPHDGSSFSRSYNQIRLVTIFPQVVKVLFRSNGSYKLQVKILGERFS